MEPAMEVLLAKSLAAAAEGAEVHPNVKVFHILDHVFLGTKFGAADRDALSTLKVRAVINMTAGPTRVPNYFANLGIEYVHIELMDELVSNPNQAMPMAYRAIRRFGEEGKRVLVHCSAGLSRSVSAVLLWLMRDHDLSLKEAKELVEVKRGRRPKCNPSFWCYLSALERELRGWAPGTPPSLDWTPMAVEDMQSMGLPHKAARIADAVVHSADWVDFTSFYTELSGPGFKHLMVAQAVAQRQAPEVKIACRAAGFALEMMEVYHMWPAVLAFALRVLQPLLCHTDSRVCQKLCMSGVVGKVLAPMMAHIACADMQEAGCATIAYVVSTVPASAGEVAFLGAVARVLEALRTHPNDEVLHTTGCICLVVMLQHPECRAQFLAQGGVGTLLKSMQTHAKAGKVQAFCISAAQTLATEPSGIKELQRNGAVRLLEQVTRNHPEHQNAQRVLRALELEAPKRRQHRSAEQQRREEVDAAAVCEPLSCV